MNYTSEEKILMIKWYYQGNSYQNVSDMFAALYPNRPIPAKSTVERTIKKFETKGTVINNCRCEEKQEQRRDARNDRDLQRQEQRRDARNDRDLQVLLCVEENDGKISTRKLEDDIGLDHTTALRALKRHKYYSYKYEKHQELRDRDEIR